jgi:hypothetical protein
VAVSLFNAVMLDVTVVICCVACLTAFARLSVTHPATIYLIFHCGFISIRAVAVLNGATTLFSWRGSVPVSESEIARAVILADLALMAMTSAWIFAHYRAATSTLHKRLRRLRALQPKILKIVAMVCIPVGCVAMLLWSRILGFSIPLIQTDSTYSNWAIIAQTWAGLSLLALTYWYELRPSLVISLSVYMCWVIYQGNFRFRLLIPLILLKCHKLARTGEVRIASIAAFTTVTPAVNPFRVRLFLIIAAASGLASIQ